MPVAIPFSTIPELFSNLTARFGDGTRPLIMYKVNGRYAEIGYNEMGRRIDLFACGLASLDIGKGDRVAIISENRPEWVVSDLAIVSLGAVDVPIYPTMTAKQTEFILNDAGVKLVIVSNQFQLAKVVKILQDVPSLKHIIVMSERGVVVEHGALRFSTILERGEEFRKCQPDYVRLAAGQIRPEDLLTLIYTSGTTGSPRGVMLTHGNLVSNIVDSAKVLEIMPGDRMLSFLPLNHSFERMAGYYTGMACGATVIYAESVDTVPENMLETRPNVITTVPRLFERIHGRIMKQVDASPLLRRRIFSWAVKIGKEYQKARRRGAVTAGLNLRHRLADRLVFRKIRARTGGQVKFFISGGAALPRELGEFFEAVGIVVLEGYGLTETSPVLTVNRLENYKFGSVGQAIPNVELRIADDGEILARGPNIMKGYWNNPEATAEAIDRDGWFHTGDIGMLDSDGFLYITDRKKHLFVSSGGKNIAPQHIENLFLTSRFIDQFVLIGDRRMFLTALIVPDFEALRLYAQRHHLPYSTDGDLVQLKEIHQAIETDIQQLQKDLAHYERVRRFTLLEKPFTIEEGELTPSQKIKRRVVEEKYAHLIEGMYRSIG